jgi:cell wall-associated NlpC family hydrolase
MAQINTDGKRAGTDSLLWYAKAERVAALQASARSWIGTKFHAHAQIKQGGVDCLHLVHAVYEDSGLFACHPVAPFPAYSIQEGIHGGKSADPFRDWVDASGRFQEWNVEQLAPGELEPGDLIVMKLGRIPHHCGVVIEPGRFLSVISGFRAMVFALHDSTWWSRVTGVWSPIET